MDYFTRSTFLSEEQNGILYEKYNHICRLMCNGGTLEEIEESIKYFSPSAHWTSDDYSFREEAPNKLSWLAGFLGKWDIFLSFYFSYEEIFPESAFDRMRSLGEFYWTNELVFFATSGAIRNNQMIFFNCLLDRFAEKDEFEPYTHISTFYNLNDRNTIMTSAIQKCSQEMSLCLSSCEQDEFKNFFLFVISKINQEHLNSTLFQMMFPIL